MTKIKSTIKHLLISSVLAVSANTLSQQLEPVEPAEVKQTVDKKLKASEPVSLNQAANDEQQQSSPSNIDELKSAIQEVMREKSVPAVGIAMLDENGPVWVGSLGLANLETQTPADENSLFRIGSTSKMLVALAVLKLVEEGQLSLSDKVRELIPDIEFENPWSDTNPILVAHLLEHTTGWDDVHLVEYANNDPTPLTLKKSLDFHPHSRISRWVPGTRASYCNSGPAVAAYIVERVTGHRFEDYIQTNFFDPLGMDTATYFYDEKVKQEGVTLYDNLNRPQDYRHILMRPSGSINASPVDMSKFLQVFLNRGAVDGKKIIQPSSLERMEMVKTTNAARVDQQAGYGLHNYSSPFKSWTYRGHDGSVSGGHTVLSYLPSAKLGHVIMINSGNFEAVRAISKMVRNFETRLLKSNALTEGIQLTEKHQSIAGLYYPINSRQQMSYFMDRIFKVQSFQIEGNKLVQNSLFGMNNNNYYALSENLFSRDDNPVSTLSITNDPLVGRVLHLNNTVYKPTNALLVYGHITIMGLWVLSMLSTILFLFVWGIRKLNGKIPSGGATRIRVWPLLASLSIVLTMILFISSANDPFETLGKPSGYSVGIMLSTIAFALFAFLSLYTAIKEKKTPMNQVAYWYCSISSILHSMVALYLLWFGVIGMMTWG